MSSLLETQEFLVNGQETKMEFRFGVKAETVEQAYRWVELAMGLTGEPRESSHLGGDYYAFRGSDGVVAKLISNRDEYDKEPVIDGCDEWPVVLYIEGASNDAPAIQNLLNDAEHFVLVSSR